MTKYYGKLQKLGPFIIDQVKRELFIYILIENGGYHISSRTEKGAIRAAHLYYSVCVIVIPWVVYLYVEIINEL